jgi:CRISPR-associated protein Cmr6
MPMAAAPAYLGRDFKDASPALRFGLLLPIWTTRADQELDVKRRAEAKSREGDEVRDLLARGGMDHAISVLQARKIKPLPGRWDKNDAGARGAWKNTCTLSPRDVKQMEACAARQSALAQPLAAQGVLLTLDARSIAPFATGLGNEHPLENGFAFLNPYGLPYLPGSGVKGVLRQAARELESGDWGDTKGWTEDAITHLFGLESDDGDKTHQRGALCFWDVLPQLEGSALQVDVMTPHQSHYYQQRREARSGDSTAPHDSGQPNPIHFLTVPPGSRFTFHVQCDLPFLRRLAAPLAEEARWQALLQAAFEHAFAWLGFGAKTAVGYGAMTEDEQARARRETERAEAAAQAAAQAEQARIESLSPVDRDWALAQPDLEQFRSEFEKAKAAGAYNPGGPFNQTRQTFVKKVLAWTEGRSRAAAAALLEQTATKNWGRPSNKERWAELQAVIQQLKDGA